MLNKKVASPLGYNPQRQRQKHDFYSTDPTAIDYLLTTDTFNKNIWEPAVGNGNLAQRLTDYGYNVIGSDIVDRGYPETIIQDFLTLTHPLGGGKYDIITNPPYKHVTEFTKQAVKLTNRKVALFLKIQYLETIDRYQQIFKKTPPKSVNVFVKRMQCYKNDNRQDTNNAVCYCWFIWDKKYSGSTKVQWINNTTKN